MPTARVSKRLIYQRVVWNLPTTQNLGTLLTSLAGVPVAERQQPLSDDAAESSGTWCKLIRQYHEAGCFYGKLVRFTHGLKQETVRTRVTVGLTPTDLSEDGAAEAPSEHEFSDATLYFCVDGNHIVLAQSQGMKVSSLEGFLNWFLNARDALPAGQFLALESIAAAEGREILDRTETSAVTIGRPVELGRPTTTASKTYSTDASLHALEGLLGIDDIRESLPADALAVGRIQTAVTFSWSKKIGGTRPEATLSGLKKLALKQLDEDPALTVIIQTPKGKLYRDKLSLAKTVTLATTDGRLPASEVFGKLLKFLKQLRQTAEITD